LLERPTGAVRDWTGLGWAGKVEENEQKQGVLILSVDDDQCAIRGRGRECWRTQHFAEGLDLSCGRHVDLDLFFFFFFFFCVVEGEQNCRWEDKK
jgi:hypothetical protein